MKDGDKNVPRSGDLVKKLQNFRKYSLSDYSRFVACFLSVSDFARQMAAVYEQFAKDIQTIISAFKAKYSDLNHDR